MLASAVSDVGVIVDVVINRRATADLLHGGEVVDAVAMEAYEGPAQDVVLAENVTGPRLDLSSGAAASTRTLQHDGGHEADRAAPVVDARLFYVCTPVNARLTQRLFHYLNVLPFGLRSPSEVFGVVGRHTNLGLVVGVTEDGQYRVVPYTQPQPHPQPLRLERVRCAPHLSYHVDDPAAGTVDPACLLSIHRESHSHRVRQSIERFFLRAAARQARSGHRGSVLSSSFMTASISVLAASGLVQPPLLPGLTKPLTRPRRRGSHAAALTGAPLPSSASGPLSPPLAASPKDAYLMPRPMPADTAAVGAPASGVGAYVQGVEDGLTSPHHPLQPDDSREVLCALSELQLPPPLALHGPVPPLRVGARVVARRFGCAEVLHMGTVVGVSFDVAYTVRYDSDGGINKGVLHSDVHELTRSDADEVPQRHRSRRQLTREYGMEPCTVRDHVVVEVAQRQQQAVVMAALGTGRYHVAVAATPVPLIEVESRQVLSVAPVLAGAVFAQPQHLALFRQLDTTNTGHISWKDVRHLVLSWEGFGKPLSFQRLGEIQRDMCIRKRSVEPQLLSKIPVQEEEQQLTFRDFEYVLVRAENLL